MESTVRYPRHMNINFRKLNKSSLTKILRHYKADYPKKDITQKELAIMVARVFEATSVMENDVLSIVAEKHCYAGADTNISKKKVTTSGSGRDHLDKEPAAPGEQVAAKVAREDGSWILGNVLEYNPTTQSYLIQDEDDISRVMTLSFNDVRRLDDSNSNLRRGDIVLAVFPETTSFYNAVVVKSPKNQSNSSNGNYEVIVKFDDDEDDSGRNPARRVPARFVLRKSDVEIGGATTKDTRGAGRNEESEEED